VGCQGFLAKALENSSYMFPQGVIRGARYCHRGALERSNVARAQLLAIRNAERGKIVERAEAALQPLRGDCPDRSY
jgi:hypothetical protein